MGAAASTARIARVGQLYEARAGAKGGEELPPAAVAKLIGELKAEYRDSVDGEVDVGFERTFHAGKLKEVDVNGVPVLVARLADGSFRATAARCPHLSLPLAGGVVANGCVTCPFHGATFALDSGDIEDGPAMRRLQTFHVRERAGRVLVALPDGYEVPEVAGLPLPEPPPPAAPGGPPPPRVVIVGGGAVAAFTAQGLRADGFAGDIVIVSAEDRAPYDRTMLSKKGAAKALLSPQWYEDNDVELRLGTAATGVDLAGRRLLLPADGAVEYDRLVIATGATPRTLTVPNCDRPGVVTVRSARDVEELLGALQGQGLRVAVIGGGVLGCEVAQLLRPLEQVAAVTLVVHGPGPLASRVGTELAAALLEGALAAGIEVRTNVAVRELLLGADGAVDAVVLVDETVPVDLVVVCIGALPATRWLRDSAGAELTLREGDGALVVDKRLQAHSSGVFAAGDVVGEGQWNAAARQARVLVRNLPLRPEWAGWREYEPKPFFWMSGFGRALRMAGTAAAEEPSEVRRVPQPEPKPEGLAAFFGAPSPGPVTAVATLGADPLASAAHNAFLHGVAHEVAPSG